MLAREAKVLNRARTCVRTVVEARWRKVSVIASESQSQFDVLFWTEFEFARELAVACCFVRHKNTH